MNEGLTAFLLHFNELSGLNVESITKYALLAVNRINTPKSAGLKLQETWDKKVCNVVSRLHNLN